MNFEIDFRAVRLFRLLLGALIAIDMIQRMFIAEAFYSDEGLLPRALVATKTLSFSLWSSPFFALGSPSWSRLLFAVMLILSLVLMTGFKARVVSLLLFFLTVGMQVRVPQILFGADVVTRVMLFWSIFLPNGPTSADHKIPRMVSAAVLIQLAIIYIAAGWLKSADAYFYQATAVYHTLSLNSCASSFGRLFLQFPDLLGFLSRAVLVVERFAWILFFVPWKKNFMRLTAFGLFSLLQGGIYLCMNLGLFPLLNLTFLVLLLPGSVFKRPVSFEATLRPTSPAARYLVPFFLVLFIFMNLSQAVSTKHRSDLQRAFFSLGLSQSWDFFAPYPLNQEGEWVISGRDAAGAQTDLTETVFPKSAFGRLAFGRFSQYLMNRRHNELFRSLARYACKRWRHQHPDTPLASLDILLALRTVPDAPKAPHFRFESVATALSDGNLSSCDMKLSLTQNPTER